MKKIALGLVALLLVIATGCRKDDSEVIATIPANTGFFAVVNIENINEKLGNTVSSDGDVKLNADLSALFDKMGIQGRELKLMLSDNQASIDYTLPVALFEYKGSSISTFFVTDPGQFREFFQKKGVKFSESKGVWESEGKVFLADNQVWISDGASTFTAQTVKYLQSLDEKDSLKGVEYAVKLAEEDSDIFGWADISKLTSSVYGSGNTMASAGLTTLFDDGKYVPFKLNFNDGNITADLKVLNSKYQPAPYLLKSAGINMEVLEQYQGKGDILFAVAVDPAQVQQLTAQFGPLLGAGMKPLMDALGSIDGTIVGSMKSASIGPAFGIQTRFTSAEAASQAAAQIRNFLPTTEGGVEVNGNQIYLHTSALEGKSVAALAPELKGAQWGIVLGGSEINQLSQGMLRKAVLKGVLDGNSCVVSLRVDTKQGQNALKSLVEILAQYQQF